MGDGQQMMYDDGQQAAQQEMPEEEGKSKPAMTTPLVYSSSLLESRMIISFVTSVF